MSKTFNQSVNDSRKSLEIIDSHTLKNLIDNKEDLTIIETAIRETVEETNGHLFSYKHNFETCKQILMKEFEKQKPNPIYVESCKYILFPLRLMYKNRFLSLKRFGKKELHDNLIHSYKWLDYIPNNIHPRLYKARESLNYL